jgi:NTP pyrophosphatase (non-canonical NTP hydrolase)
MDEEQPKVMRRKTKDATLSLLLVAFGLIMDLSPLETLLARYDLKTAPEWSLLDMGAQLGDLTRALLKQTNFGREEIQLPPELTHEKIGDLMFAIAYFAHLHNVDLEIALHDSIKRFEKKLEGEK